MSDESRLALTPEYVTFLDDLKVRIRTAQVRAALSVNRELVLLYWQVGRRILDAQSNEGWGTKLIERLSSDLRLEFPSIKGLSPRNLKYMRAFAEAWPEEAIVQQVVAQLPWGHNVRLLDRLSTNEERLWYARNAIEFGWSRNVLEIQIGTRLHERQGQGVTNFQRVLPSSQSDLARQLIKDPYNFDFLSLGREADERGIEAALIAQLRRFLLELGVGFAFVGNQYRLEVGGEEFFIDVLFYHLKLRCYVAIELKAGPFKPEYVGKLNFYLAAVDDLLRHADDSPSIGLLLCKSKNEVLVEYSLRNVATPMGVSNYQLTESLPEEIRSALPTIEELEHELQATPNGDGANDG